LEERPEAQKELPYPLSNDDDITEDRNAAAWKTYTTLMEEFNLRNTINPMHTLTLT